MTATNAESLLQHYEVWEALANLCSLLLSRMIAPSSTPFLTVFCGYQSVNGLPRTISFSSSAGSALLAMTTTFHGTARSRTPVRGWHRCCPIKRCSSYWMMFGMPTLLVISRQTLDEAVC